MNAGQIDRASLASSMSWLLAGTALIVLDVRLSLFDVTGVLGVIDLLPDPVGALVVALGVERLLGATGPTEVALMLRAAAWLHAVLLVAVEAGVLTGSLAVGGGVADAAGAGLAWQVVATLAVVMTALGVVLLAQHLRRSLTGVAADRWRQVTIAWVATLVALPLLLLTGALELVLLGLAIVAIAGVLLLVALFATRRAAEDDDLDRDFQER